MLENTDVQFFGLVLVFLKLVLLSMVLERALVVLFEWRGYEKLNGYGLKVPITYAVAAAICHTLRFDVFTVIMNPADPNPPSTRLGIYLTAAVLAGGSAGAITLFQGVLKMTKTAQRRMLAMSTPPAGGAVSTALPVAVTRRREDITVDPVVVEIDPQGGSLNAHLQCSGAVKWHYEYRCESRRTFTDDGTSQLDQTLDLGRAIDNVNENHGLVFVLTNLSTQSQKYSINVVWRQDGAERARWPCSATLEPNTVDTCERLVLVRAE